MPFTQFILEKFKVGKNTYLKILLLNKKCAKIIIPRSKIPVTQQYKSRYEMQNSSDLKYRSK